MTAGARDVAGERVRLPHRLHRVVHGPALHPPQDAPGPTSPRTVTCAGVRSRHVALTRGPPVWSSSAPTAVPVRSGHGGTLPGGGPTPAAVVAPTARARTFEEETSMVPAVLLSADTQLLAARAADAVTEFR